MASDGVEETLHILVIWRPEHPPASEFPPVSGFMAHRYAYLSLRFRRFSGIAERIYEHGSRHGVPSRPKNTKIERLPLVHV